MLRFFFWHGSAWHASGCQKGAADGIWLLGWRLATRAKSAPKFRFRIFPIHRFSSKIDPISYMRRSTVCDSTRFRKIFGNRDFRFQTGWVWNENRLPNFSLEKFGCQSPPLEGGHWSPHWFLMVTALKYLRWVIQSRDWSSLALARLPSGDHLVQPCPFLDVIRFFISKKSFVNHIIVN